MAEHRSLINSLLLASQSFQHFLDAMRAAQAQASRGPAPAARAHPAVGKYNSHAHMNAVRLARKASGKRRKGSTKRVHGAVKTRKAARS
ncbi:MAG TPA: hypothetical protein VHN99_01135 [Deinococcales bacterium]|nr:hypothetical protein [Deinococcales bacterium]